MLFEALPPPPRCTAKAQTLLDLGVLCGKFVGHSFAARIHEMVSWFDFLAKWNVVFAHVASWGCQDGFLPQWRSLSSIMRFSELW